MTPLCKAVFASILATTTFSLAANLPRNLSRNANTVICQPNAGCIHHTIFGHDYKMLSTDRFSVMVFLSTEGRYTRADVSITNLTPTPINLSPEVFRIEAINSRSKVFLYVPPSQLENIPAQTQATPNDAPATQNQNSNSEISELEAARQRAEQEAAELAATTPHLTSIVIPPNQAVYGRVYFEHDPSATHQQVNVVLPIADTVFKFPDVIKP
jgi:hypothetical protein